MRKLKLQVQVTIDGYICGPKGEMDWLVMNWTSDIKEYVDSITDPVDTILLGRKLAEGFIPHWASVASDPANPENAAGRKFSETQKIVFSKSLKSSPWGNTIVAGGDIVSEVSALKKKEGKDIIAYGGSDFVSSLIRHRLIDELHLFVNPAAIGTGMPIFHRVTDKQVYEVSDVKLFTCGIVMTKYNLAL